MTPDRHANPLDALSSAAGLVAALVLCWLAASRELPPPAPAAAPGLVPADGFRPCDVPGGGWWRGSVYGERRLDFAWDGAALECDGNARPAGRGLRLFFAGRTGEDGSRLMIVIGVGAALDTLRGTEQPVNVTLIDESTSSFFNTPDERCFARFDEVAAIAGTDGWRVAGELYCAGSLPAVAGPGSVTLGDMQFAGRLVPESP